MSDIADAHVRTIDQREPGESHIISSDPREVLDIFELASAMTGRPVRGPFRRGGSNC